MATQSSSPHHHLLEVNQNEPDGNFFGTPEYSEWQRLLRSSTKLREPVLKFIINLITYTGETSSLILTLITGLIIPTKDVHETITAIVLYIICCGITTIVSHYNKKNTSSGANPRKYDIILNFLMILKPYRYVKEYLSKNEKLRIVKIECNGTTDNIRVTKQALTSLKELNAELLEYKRAEFHETVLQAIPMCLLQNYFLFQSYETFRLCDINDLSRLALIGTTVLNAAKSCSEYQSSKSDYEAVLHFLSYYKSRGQHPIKIESQGMLTINGLLNIITHIANISLRFYMFSYFLNTSVLLAIICLILVFLVNLILVKLFPQHLLEIHQNAPYGISTTPSYWTDRIMDIFVNVSTRYNKFTHYPINFRIFKARIPLIFVQTMHFVIPLLTCFTLAWLHDNHLHQLLDSVIVKGASNGTTIKEYVEECPEIAEWYGSNDIYNHIGNIFYPIFQSVDDRFSNYGDLFNIIHVIWLLFYTQVLTAWVYAFSLNGSWCCSRVEHYDVYENYPVMVAYGFYSSMFDQLLRLKLSEKLNASRKLMVLTILHPHEFYKLIRVCGVFQRRTISEKFIKSEMVKLVDPKRMNKTDEQVEKDLETCKDERHVLQTYFNAVQESLVLPDDKRLFLIFRSYFDRKMYVTQSHRIESIFKYMNFNNRKNLV
ncbi:unnamed protein product [Orchesella dallaii]|uniref:Uncharacterized protein n=1 Tax=Orchesella dallaii TaxID=48710 RepID=A0ABP1RBZ6_9HEXA